jgi:hypothetical protein
MNKKLLVRSFFLCVCVCVCGGRVQQLINSSRCLFLLPTEMAYTYQSSFSLSLFTIIDSFFWFIFYAYQ